MGHKMIGLIVGAGKIAEEYLRICLDLNLNIDVISRSRDKVEQLVTKYGIQGFDGGIESFKPAKNYQFAIVATNTDQLFNSCKCLIKLGIKRVLVEKPAGLDFKEIYQLGQIAKDSHCEVYVAYNRRFFTSTLKLKEILKNETPLSCHFEFTEWPDSLKKYNYHQSVYDNLLIGNSSHVIDLVFELIGMPKSLITHSENKTDWSDNPGIFIGMGKSINNVLFTYHTNWLSAGRWGIEIMTSQRRYILKPLEKLQFQNKNEVQISEISIDDCLDQKYKPGFFLQLKNFIENPEKLLSLDSHIEKCKIIEKIKNLQSDTLSNG